MAENANPQAVKITNEQLRPLAEVTLSAIETARTFSANYSAVSGDTLFPNTADLLADGSETDGRPRVQCQTVRAMRTLAQDLLVWAAVGSPTREARLRSITDKGQSRF